MWHPSTCTHGVAGVGDVLGGGAVVERKTGLGDHFPRIRANNVSLQVSVCALKKLQKSCGRGWRSWRRGWVVVGGGLVEVVEAPPLDDGLCKR